MAVFPQPDIIAFAKDWGQDPTSCNHVLRELARERRVLWLNSIATRSPKAGSGGDWRRILRKVSGFLRGPVHVADGLWVYTPLVLPFHQNRVAVALNRLILRTCVLRAARRLEMRHIQLWTWLPSSASYLGSFDEELRVYYCTDAWSEFSSVNGPATERSIEELARKSDVVFATSRLLVDRLQSWNPNTKLASHGVDHDLFSRALDPTLPEPEDIKLLSRPIIGYYGLIEEWLDLDLIEFLARRNPTWSIVLLGKECVDTSNLRALPNVHLLGRKRHSELPNYCRQFAAGIIPHRVNALTQHMNPIKLREYISAGLPVIATDLPEVRRHPMQCRVAETYLAFEDAVRMAVKDDSYAERCLRSATMRRETWPEVVAGLQAAVQMARDDRELDAGRLESLSAASTG